MKVRFRLAIALIAGALIAPVANAQESNVLNLGQGVIPVVEPPTYGAWPVVGLLDDSPTSGWACEAGKVADNVFVFELPSPAAISAFELDTGKIDGNGRGAKDVTIEVSAAGKDSGYQQVLKATLADRKDSQRFPVQHPIEGSWVRLTIANNHGDPQWTELTGLRAFGTPKPMQAVGNISGTYQTTYGDFHLRQQGTSLTGCYEHKEGLFDGAVEGRVMTLTWKEGGNSHGPAVLVFSPAGTSFRGYWWYNTDKGNAPAGAWVGTRTSSSVGTCPHWSGSVSGELHKGLAATGRVRLYGILFDTDSARIRSESLPTLDEVVALLASEPSWKLTIEGHTDASGTAPHNQTLSEQRAQSVRDYLVGKGVAAARLATAGFGQSKPVADNATEIGRAQNRRVELVRN